MIPQQDLYPLVLLYTLDCSIGKVYDQKHESKSNGKRLLRLKNMTFYVCFKEQINKRKDGCFLQRKMDRKKMEKAEELRNKKAAVHAKAQEQKVKVQTRRAQEILDAEEKAARFQAMGQIPKKSSLSCF